jgi:translation initiation factor 4G
MLPKVCFSFLGFVFRGFELVRFVGAEPQQRKRLVLQPRTKPAEPENAETSSPTAESDGEQEDGATGAPEMTDEAALRKAAEDVKEFFLIRNPEDVVYFADFPAKHRSKLVEKLLTHVVEAKAADAQLLAQLFANVAAKEACTPEAFEEGIMPIAEMIDDIAIDSPKALDLFATAVKGAGLDETRLSNIVAKSMDADKLLELLQ